MDVDVDSRQTISLRALAMALLLKAVRRFAVSPFRAAWSRAYARMEDEAAAKTMEMKDMTFMKLRITFDLIFDFLDGFLFFSSMCNNHLLPR